MPQPTEEKSQCEKCTKGRSCSMKHKKSTPDNNVDAWDLVSQNEQRTSVFVIPRYLANLNFWDIYSVGNSKTRKPGEANNKP
jgi:hypothetical protein